MSQTAVKTPCIKVCAIDGQTGYCLGCGRQLTEIASWLSLDERERDVIIADLPARREKLKSLGKLG